MTIGTMREPKYIRTDPKKNPIMSANNVHGRYFFVGPICISPKPNDAKINPIKCCKIPRKRISSPMPEKSATAIISK